MRLAKYLAAAAALVLACACEVTVKDGSEPSEQNDAAAQQPNQAQQLRDAQLAQLKRQAQEQSRDIRFVVDISDRRLQILQGNRVIRQEPVAVGTSEWPTPTGSWQIHQVDINPEWVPPKDEEWAKDEERKAPGDPDNPMGKVRLVYRMPNTIHGTDDLQSLGKASSHGSIRVANEVALQLAQMVLKVGGAWEGDQWFQQMVENRTREFQLKLADPVPIEVQE